MAAKTASKIGNRPSSAQSKPRQSTLVPQHFSKKPSTPNGTSNGRARSKANGNILTFFKKAEEQNNRLFLQDRNSNDASVDPGPAEDLGWEDSLEDEGTALDPMDEAESRFNEVEGSVKKRRISKDEAIRACTPPPPEPNKDAKKEEGAKDTRSLRAVRLPKRNGPFVDDSDSEDCISVQPIKKSASHPNKGMSAEACSDEICPAQQEIEIAVASVDRPTSLPVTRSTSPSPSLAGDFDGFEGLVDDDFPEGEEYEERRFMAEQRRLEMVESGIEGETDDLDVPAMFNDDIGDVIEGSASTAVSMVSSCPICNASLVGLLDQQVSVHVNGCLDGNPTPLPKSQPSAVRQASPSASNSRVYKRPPRPARPGQENPFSLDASNSGPKSAFNKIMASHAEDAAWATAAAAESAARGKPSYQRTCPFYKILPGFYICVDAFRYGAVKGQQAYFLSHFHSDHYVGLTASWSHGPIYCSQVTANLVRQQLRVDPKWVVDLEFEQKTEVPGTEGVHVTMIPANHCPGSSLFLFEKELGKGKNSKLQRVLHCGDFRACRAHVEHPLLRPEVLDTAGGKNRQQKIDVCYLDTTYLNPKYAFPPQEQVIKACADMCVSLNKVRADETDGWETMKRERAGEGMIRFVRKGSDIKQEESEEEDVDAMKVTQSHSTKSRGRLLVVVGTYSIGKERICLGIAHALGSKIYAPPSKQRICHALEDAELNALLTSDPREAQVHMTPLFEIRAETLEDYLKDYRDYFSRAVGFRPSGWNYRPPNSRFVESPSVQTVLYSQNWKSLYSMRDLVPQRGSTSRASCFGVPYSEHSSFCELTMFCCALRIDKIIPTVNVGNAKSREKMKAWCEKWATEKKKNGLFKLGEEGSSW